MEQTQSMTAAAAVTLASNTQALGLVASSAVDTVLATGTAAAAAAATTSGASIKSEVLLTCENRSNTTPAASTQEAAAWDAHLDFPYGKTDPLLTKEVETLRRVSLGLTKPEVVEFVDGCEFISLGCFCAPTYSLQLLGLKKYSYPFDWVRSSIDGIIHCLQYQFQDFLTYSTYRIEGSYVVFGGTRWGGSFWHHNLEAPVTREDMSRRVVRFYGRGEVPPMRPRVFVRCVNSTREVDSALRLWETLRQALPEAAEVLLLLIVDLQSTTGAIALAGECRVLFYQIHESQTVAATKQGATSLKCCAEVYAHAIAFATRFWAGDCETQSLVRTFSTLAELNAACEQWDGGDPSRDLFAPRRFFGQQLSILDGGVDMLGLLAKIQTQNIWLPEGTVDTKPFMAQCFGKHLRVTLPKGSSGGHILQLTFENKALTGFVYLTSEGQLLPIGQAVVAEEIRPALVSA